MLTKKNFEAIAEILKEHKASDKMVHDFIEYLQTTNPKFQEDKFKENAQD